MKTTLLFLLLSIGSASLADHHEGNFEENKKKMTEHIDERIKALQDHKTCVSGAKDKEGLKACHEKMKATRMEWKEDFLEMKKEKAEKRLERHKEKNK